MQIGCRPCCIKARQGLSALVSEAKGLGNTRILYARITPCSPAPSFDGVVSSPGFILSRAVRQTTNNTDGTTRVPFTPPSSLEETHP